MIVLKAETLILGLGRSGQAAARLLISEGRAVTVVDGGNPTAADTLRELGATVITECDELPFGPFDLAVVSPGIPIDSPWIQSLRARGIPCVSELELGWSRCAADKTLAITGSLGKSTMATWCAKALETAGLRVVLAGNIGLPVCEVALQGEPIDVLVLEVSSFQCETLQTFCPDVGVLLNLFPNHLDRHADMSSYFSAKMAMFQRMSERDTAVVPQAQVETFARLHPGRATQRVFGSVTRPGAWIYEQGRIMCDGRSLVDLRGTAFENPILGENAAAAVAALDALGVPSEAMEKSAKIFQSLPHRMEFVAGINEVDFINDSKSTSLTSTVAAVNMIEGPVHLIIGGKAKETDFNSIESALSQAGVRVYLIGDSAEAMQHAWEDKLICINSGTLQKAVQQCWSNAGAGHTILLSPGCASFDQFENFEDRGRKFCELVERIKSDRHQGASSQS